MRSSVARKGPGSASIGATGNMFDIGALQVLTQLHSAVWGLPFSMSNKAVVGLRFLPGCILPRLCCSNLHAAITLA